MTQEGWYDAIKKCIDEPTLLDALAKYLAEVDEAKRLLGEKGYRVSGQPLLHVVKTLPDYDR